MNFKCTALLALILLPLQVLPDVSIPSKQLMVGFGIVGGVGISGIAIRTYQKYRDRYVDSQEVVQELEKEFVNFVGRMINKWEFEIQHKASTPSVNDPNSIIRSIVTSYGNSKYKYLDYAHSLTYRINNLESSIHGKNGAIKLLNTIKRFLNNEIMINEVNLGDWNNEKHKVFKKFYYDWSTCSPNTIEKGSLSQEIRNQLVIYSKKLQQIIDAYKTMQNHLVELRVIVENMREYKQEIILDAKDHRLQQKLAEKRRQKQVKYEHELALEKARRPIVNNSIYCPHCYGWIH